MRPLRLVLAAVLLALTPVLLASPAVLAAPGVSLAGGAGVLHRGVGDGIVLIADEQPLGAVLRAIGERYPGRALDARRIERDGRALYRIKWLGDDGKVREITADANTGGILSVR
jgi:hypothetical protein